MDSYGFIITRHVNSEKTNKYWNNSIKCIRRFYPYKKIVIIDDNSNQELVKAEYDYKNVEIIQSEFPGRGELLPYYYFLKTKFFENAIILHDSVFIHSRINFEKMLGIKVLPLWFFEADKENVNNTTKITSGLKNSYNILQKLSITDDMPINTIGTQKQKWYGCFGVQSFINHNFLNGLEQKYNISAMIHSVKNRADRCCLERIMGCIFFTECKEIQQIKSLMGNIRSYQTWGYSYEEYEKNIKNVKKPIIKVWTGR